MYTQQCQFIKTSNTLRNISLFSVNLCSNTEDKLQIYRDNFEKAYIEATEAFYKMKAPQYLQANGVQNYMRYADAKLREEEIRAQKYLEPCSGSVQLVRYTLTLPAGCSTDEFNSTLNGV